MESNVIKFPINPCEDVFEFPDGSKVTIFAGENRPLTLAASVYLLEASKAALLR